MSAPIDVAAGAELRCHSCSHVIGTTEATARLAAIFRPSEFGEIRVARPDEIRRRCRSCGWVNVFHPLTNRRPLGTVRLK